MVHKVLMTYERLALYGKMDCIEYIAPKFSYGPIKILQIFKA